MSALLGERFTTNASVREQHGRGEAVHAALPPDAVAFPTSTGEVASIVRHCATAGLPVIAFGAGTSLEGQVQAPFGGVSLDLSLMDKVLSASAADLDCRVQAGVRLSGLNRELREAGLFFPVDPGADATLGGMASTRASGTNAVRYGTMRELTLGLTVVTAAGEVVRAGGRARKSATGYDLTRLFVGSEGTLGVITELQLRVFGLPETVAAASCQFERLEDAVQAVVTALQSGLPLARIELLDGLQMAACIAYSRLEGLRPCPTLFLEFHGTAGTVADQVALMRAIADQSGGEAFRWAEQAEDRSRLWKARHDAFHAGRALAPGKQVIVTDACVPLSALAAAILAARAEADAMGLVCPITGHVGDGNFHALILFDPDDAQEQRKAQALSLAIARRAIDAGGTCSGEHGIGSHRLGLMREEHGAAIGIMQAIKSALDPFDIMNPGKTVPVDEFS